MNYIEEKKTSGLDPSTFARCKRVMCAEYVKDFDSTEEIAGDLLGYVFDEGEMFTYGDLLRQVSQQDVEELLREVFDSTRVCMAVITPLDNKKNESEE